ncbi:CRISPR system precrRNA processing endoribonuclease RAMP protein Cas6 [Ornithinimicrobium avium]|uniref:CRISPR system precrRNA processing endoribonuclease RAMP protein Cas6 n=1 Tax=Ornithinimicrobium avium TaxID=2283195 RepID=A0A345NLP8_9MICO|nr:CRISPR system precrRNA processing endoribonuclease RAMP protein Cas6 [Ornithinimicrobium avium]AXH95956.1 CRISPR system precrRNA processing endoribonuclease RAMP protein Cas6 [Ornithinimicrobium avium]
MPSRWWIPVEGVDMSCVRIEHVHAAISRWFDRSLAEHHSGSKPYTISPPATDDEGRSGIELSVLSDEAHRRFFQGAEVGAAIRLGHQQGAIGMPISMHRHSWADMAQSVVARAWNVDLITPTTFRNGDRSSPLPNVRTIMTSLSQSWATWGATPAPDSLTATRGTWVSGLELSSTSVSFPVNQRGKRTIAEVVGSLGTLQLMATEEAARATGPLLQWAAYTGLGGMTRRGLGMVRIEPLAVGSHGRPG